MFDTLAVKYLIAQGAIPAYYGVRRAERRSKDKREKGTMTAKVESLEGQFEERCDVYEPGVVPVQRAMWWRLALAAVLLAIILVLAATVLIYSPTRGCADAGGAEGYCGLG